MTAVKPLDVKNLRRFHSPTSQAQPHKTPDSLFKSDGNVIANGVFATSVRITVQNGNPLD